MTSELIYLINLVIYPALRMLKIDFLLELN
jgi:hypothetical protein